MAVAITVAGCAGVGGRWIDDGWVQDLGSAGWPVARATGARGRRGGVRFTPAAFCLQLVELRQRRPLQRLFRRRGAVPVGFCRSLPGS